jgi:hypothetical protein
VHESLGDGVSDFADKPIDGSTPVVDITSSS